MTTIETDRISDFLLRLGDDESLLAQFMQDPQGMLESSRLQDESVSALLEGDSQRVGAAVAADVARDPHRSGVVTAPRMYMAPEPEPGDDQGDDGDDSDDDDQGDSEDQG